MINQGKYKARAIGGEFGASAKKKTPFVRVQFEVVDEGEDRGELVAWTGYFTDTTRTRTIEALQHCGCTFPNDDIEDLTGLAANIVQIVVEHEDYQDEAGEYKTTAKVAWVNSLGGRVRETERMDDATRASFKSQMKGALMAAAGAAARSRPNGGTVGGGAARPHAHDGGADPTDDIPFATSLPNARGI